MPDQEPPIQVIESLGNKATKLQYLSKLEVSQILGYSKDTFTKHALNNPPETFGLGQEHARMQPNGSKGYSVEYIAEICRKYSREPELAKLMSWVAGDNVEQSQPQVSGDSQQLAQTIAVLEKAVESLERQLIAKDDQLSRKDGHITDLLVKLSNEQTLLRESQSQIRSMTEKLPSLMPGEGGFIMLENKDNYQDNTRVTRWFKNWFKRGN